MKTKNDKTRFSRAELGVGNGQLDWKLFPRPEQHPGLDIQKPLSSEYGTCKTVKARFWLWLSGKSP